VPYAALPHARHVDGARKALEPLDVHRILLRKLSEGDVTATQYLLLALFEERDEGRDEEVVARNTHAGRLVLRARARLEELRKACLSSYGLHVVVNAHRPQSVQIGQ